MTGVGTMISRARVMQMVAVRFFIGESLARIIWDGQVKWDMGTRKSGAFVGTREIRLV
jgi:hypothetical protein|tara:strand:+ start:57 stop:230 length:174 start_codon:yes stop_codon:yes gene_type:complete